MKEIVGVLCFLLCVSTGNAAGQAIRVGRSAVMPGAAIGGSVSVTAAPAFVTFQLVPQGVAASSSGVGVTTTWTGLTRLCETEPLRLLLGRRRGPLRRRLSGGQHTLFRCMGPGVDRVSTAVHTIHAEQSSERFRRQPAVIL